MIILGTLKKSELLTQFDGMEIYKMIGGFLKTIISSKATKAQHIYRFQYFASLCLYEN